MNDAARKALARILASFGQSIVERPQQLRALLSDDCPGQKLEVNVLVSAVEQRIPADLLNRSSGVPWIVLSGRLASRLKDDTGLSEEASRWAVTAWAVALGVVEASEAAPRPAEPPPLPPAPTPAPARKPVMPPSKPIARSPQKSPAKPPIKAPTGIRNRTTKPVARTARESAGDEDVDVELADPPRRRGILLCIAALVLIAAGVGGYFFVKPYFDVDGYVDSSTFDEILRFTPNDAEGVIVVEMGALLRSRPVHHAMGKKRVLSFLKDLAKTNKADDHFLQKLEKPEFTFLAEHLLTRTARVTFFLVPQVKNGFFNDMKPLLVFQGKYERDKILANLKMALSDSPQPLKTETVGNNEIAATSDKAGLSFIGGSIMVFGDRELVETALNIDQGKLAPNPKVLQSDLLTKIARGKTITGTYESRRTPGPQEPTFVAGWAQLTNTATDVSMDLTFATPKAAEDGKKEYTTWADESLQYPETFSDPYVVAWVKEVRPVVRGSHLACEFSVPHDGDGLKRLLIPRPTPEAAFEFTDFKSRVRDARVSPNGAYLAAVTDVRWAGKTPADRAGEFVLYDFKTKALVFRRVLDWENKDYLQGEEVAFHPSSKLVAVTLSAGGAARTQIWDIGQQRLVISLDGRGGSFSQTGDTIALFVKDPVNNSGNFRLHRISDWSALPDVPVNIRWMFNYGGAFAFAPKNNSFAAITAENGLDGVAVWKTGVNESLVTPAARVKGLSGGGQIEGIAWSPGGNRIAATAFSGGTVHVFDAFSLAENKKYKLAGKNTRIRDIAYGSDDSIAVSLAGQFAVISPASGQARWYRASPYTFGGDSRVSFSNDARYLIATREQCVLVWQLK